MRAALHVTPTSSTTTPDGLGAIAAPSAIRFTAGEVLQATGQAGREVPGRQDRKSQLKAHSTGRAYPMRRPVAAPRRSSF
ncbi:hypothetical protein GCM10010404_50180 [Nonomuraea africana]|uniref:Uncharacterized protein n=1 Tax=Nonomuraea africana TaxID=46171 RepID=A0ABR9KVF7_9ACTN|nr:hypothetical protein [Nonomuraea africana]MBE1566014.1 hypothetical protein [Nonomuraea africana]